MQRIVSILLLIAFLLGGVGGCASMSEKEFTAWVQANTLIAKEQSAANSNKMFDFKMCSDGRGICELSMYHAPRPFTFIDQKRPSEWAPVVQKFLNVGGAIGGALVAGEIMKDIVDSVGKNSGHNISGSYNTDRHDTTTTNTDNSIKDSYNTDNSVNDSNNPVDNSVDNSDNRYNYDNPVNTNYGGQ